MRRHFSRLGRAKRPQGHIAQPWSAQTSNQSVGVNGRGKGQKIMFISGERAGCNMSWLTAKNEFTTLKERYSIAVSNRVVARL